MERQSRRARSSSIITCGSSGGPQSLELTCQPGVAVEPLLTGERGKPGCLGEIGVVTLDDLKFNVQSRVTDKADDVVEADRGAAGFPTCNRGLGPSGRSASSACVRLARRRASRDQISAVGTHGRGIFQICYV